MFHISKKLGIQLCPTREKSFRRSQTQQEIKRVEGEREREKGRQKRPWCKLLKRRETDGEKGCKLCVTRAFGIFPLRLQKFRAFALWHTRLNICIYCSHTKCPRVNFKSCKQRKRERERESLCVKLANVYRIFCQKLILGTVVQTWNRRSICHLSVKLRAFSS